MRVTSYARCSTDEQGISGLGLEAQRSLITSEIERRGWQLSHSFEDVAKSGKDMRRLGVQAALKTLHDGDADALVVAKLDRLSRSMLDFAGVMALAHKEGWALVALDMNVDTTTPAGEAMAHVMATFSQLERRLIGQRTREALAVKRANGVRLGRPPEISLAVAERIHAERAAGASLRQIAIALETDGIQTARGGRWQPATLARVLARSGESGTG